MPDPLPNREGRIGSGDRAYNVSFPSRGTLMGVWFVYIRSWLLEPTLVVICATVEVAKSEKNRTSTHSSSGVAFATTQRWVM